MTQNTHAFLRVHMEEPTGAKVPQLDEFATVRQLCHAFEDTTGWKLRYRHGPTDTSSAAWSRSIAGNGSDEGGLLAVESRCVGSPVMVQGRSEPQDIESVTELADAVGDVLEELQQTRLALWEREAELAAGVPITAHADEAAHLASRLESVLKTGSQAINCQAAALYMLDDATKYLKLRSCWGLPKSRFLQPPRPLRGAAADLEALVGHAVVLEDISFLSQWRVPEEFRSAVCVPVSDATTLLGTLWMFCESPRGFSHDETNLIEILAGRLASDLEREILLSQLLQSRTLDDQLGHAAEWQHNRLPRIKPLLAGWQVAGWNAQADCLGGDFYDWYGLPDGTLAVAVGDAQGRMCEAGMTAAAVHTAMRSHAGYRHSAEKLLERVNETLWNASAGDQFASLFYAMLSPETGKFQHATAGHVYGAIIGESVRTLPAPKDSPLGTQPDGEFTSATERLDHGESLVVISEGVYRSLRASRCRVLWRLLQNHRDLSADDQVEKASRFVRQHVEDPQREDMTILVVNRS